MVGWLGGGGVVETVGGGVVVCGRLVCGGGARQRAHQTAARQLDVQEDGRAHGDHDQRPQQAVNHVRLSVHLYCDNTLYVHLYRHTKCTPA